MTSVEETPYPEDQARCQWTDWGISESGAIRIRHKSHRGPFDTEDVMERPGRLEGTLTLSEHPMWP